MIVLVSVFGNNALIGNSRIDSINNAIKGGNKIVITSDFVHTRKGYISDSEKIDGFRYLHVPKYKENLSLMRIYSHFVFALKLKRYLRTISPSVVYCAMPTSTAAYVCGKYCKQRGIKFVIDVIDLWPDSLMPIYNGLKAKMLYWVVTPWRYITTQAYRMADVILGESKEYAMCAARYNSHSPVFPIYLGVDGEYIRSQLTGCQVSIERPADEIWIAYAGSLGTSYDFRTLVGGVAALNGKYKYRLIFIGDGVCRSEVEKLVAQYSVNAQITGFVDYATLLKYLSFCDIAVNIFRNNTKVVHSYKFNDYVATNCFILNSLSGETAEMIEKYHVGLNFDFDKHPLGQVLSDVVEHWNFYREWRKNNEKLIAEVLDKKLVYSLISDILAVD